MELDVDGGGSPAAVGDLFGSWRQDPHLDVNQWVQQRDRQKLIETLGRVARPSVWRVARPEHVATLPIASGTTARLPANR
jgi:hypothetical protein